MIPTVFAITLFLHGLGHAVFAANAWGIAQPVAGNGSPAASVVADTRLTKGLLALLWLLPLAGFLLGAWMYYTGAEGWQTQLLASALLSTLMIGLWGRTINPSGALFAPAFNLFVIALLYWQGQGVLVLG